MDLVLFFNSGAFTGKYTTCSLNNSTHPPAYSRTATCRQQTRKAEHCTVTVVTRLHTTLHSTVTRYNKHACVPYITAITVTCVPHVTCSTRSAGRLRVFLMFMPKRVLAFEPCPPLLPLACVKLLLSSEKRSWFASLSSPPLKMSVMPDWVNYG